MTTNNTDKIDWDSFQTGDLALFHGEGYWFSFVIEGFTFSQFSHIGMILRDPTYLDPKLKGLYMLEAGAEQFPDAIEHRIKFGVQVVNLKKVVETYTGRVYIRKLTLEKELRSNLETTLFNVWDKIKDLPYDDSPWDLIRATFRLNWGDNTRMNDFFCSALMTFLLEQAIFFDRKIDWDLVQPKDYDNQGKVEKILIKEIELQPKYLIHDTSSWWNFVNPRIFW